MKEGEQSVDRQNVFGLEGQQMSVTVVVGEADLFRPPS